MTNIVKTTNPLVKNIIIAVVVFFVLGGIFSMLYVQPAQQTSVPASQLVSDINADKVKKIEISGNDISITFKDDKTAVSVKESNAVLPDFLINLGADKTKLQNVEINVTTPKESVWGWLLPILIYGILPLLVIGFFFWTMIKQAKTGAMQNF
jgi:ATP-dependent Zn protease